MQARRPRLAARFAPESTGAAPRTDQRERRSINSSVSSSSNAGRHPASAHSRRLVRRSLDGHVELGFRPDIEGLRAVAVVAVVAYHAHLFGVRSGFVGVDVFFVVSGFLITRLLLGELAKTGTIALRQFWARRARRLLPAAAFTVVVTLVVARQVLAPLAMRNLATDAAGAATFTSNFVFGHRDGDYFAPTAESPLKHFWSLAVEEQFYLCWPPLLVVLARRPRQYRRLLAMTLGVLVVSGFTLSIVLSQLHSTWAFWLLPTRMGELLVGAALAVAGPLVMSRQVRAAIGTVGLVGVVVSCFLYDGVPTSWPGVGVLLPVLATAAVIAAGSGTARPAGAAVMLSVPTLQWIGRHSYALYLWHWPALVLAEVQWGPLNVAQRVAVVLGAVALSAVSVRLVEDPIRHSRALGASPNASLALGACLLLLVAGVGWQVKASMGRLDGGVEAATPQLFANPAAVTTLPAATTVAAATTTAPVASTTVAAAAPSTLAVADPPTGQLAQLVSAEQRALQNASGAAAVPSNLRPSLANATERSRPYQDGCVNAAPNDNLQPCEYGVSGAGRTLLLYGDSHAAQWFEPIERYAMEHGWRLVVLLKMGCPVADVDFSGQVLPYTCPPYRDRAIAWIAEHQPDMVVVSNSYTQYGGDGAEWIEGSEATFGRLAEATDSPILVIGDNPGSPVEVPTCLSDNLYDASECNTPRDEAVRPEQLSAEVAAARTHGLSFVDTTDWFCTVETCPSIVGDILVLRDETHITIPMAMFLQPLVAAAIAGV